MLQRVCLVVACFAAALSVPGLTAFGQVRDAFPEDDFSVREEMIPMRDGVKLYTLILTPREAGSSLPILLERTPYDATRAVGGPATTRLEMMAGHKYLGGGFVYVTQDIRGRFRSEGDYAMYRVPRGQFNQSQTDETTDAWDTIEWLVKNVPSNGKVGVWGTSYPGWLTLAAMRDPHPALAAAVPFNPVVDVWKADDWFHWGAFRAIYSFDFIYSMETKKGASPNFPYSPRDLYSWMLGKGNAEALGGPLDGRHEMWKRLMENPEYGPYWKDVAADQWFEAPKRLVPALHVHGFWDQEDIYGSPAVYAAIEKHDRQNDTNFFAAGPWYHGQHFAQGSSLGAIDFDEDTAKRFREEVLAPFLNRFLKGQDAPAPSPVTVYESGANRWRRYPRWPPEELKAKSLYLHPGGSLSFSPPTANAAPTAYLSDPAKPVPYEPRPNWSGDYNNPASIREWREWLVQDQRFVDGRPDVATWTSEPLKEDLTIRGPVVAKLFAETTGTDADWVVKLIDVYPDQNPGDEAMSGYQLMISSDIFRGRYRDNFEKPAALAPNVPLEYTIPLPQANHTVKKGHRLMVQVQSTWFPLYDRNPQTFVPSIMSAPPEAYRSQTHRVHHAAGRATRVELLVDAK